MEQKCMKNGYWRNHLTNLFPWRCLVQFGFSGRRCWCRVWSARYLSGIHTCERRRKKQDWIDEKISFNAGSTNPAESPGAHLAHRSGPHWVQTDGPLYPYLAQSFGAGCPSSGTYNFEQDCSLQLSPTLKEVTAGHQVHSRSGLHIPKSTISALLLNRNSEKNWLADLFFT